MGFSMKECDPAACLTAAPAPGAAPPTRPFLRTMSIKQIVSAAAAEAVRLGECLRLDLNDPLRGSLMIHEGGMMIFLCTPRSHILFSLLASKH